MVLDPQFALLVFVVGGATSVVGAAAWNIGRKVSPMIDSSDLVPMAPPYPPLPRFLWDRPEVMQAIFGGPDNA